MTSITSSSPATAPSTTPVNASGTPQSPSINPQTSIPTTAAAAASQSSSASSPLPRGSLSYAQASRKSATIVSSPAIPTQHSIVTSSPGASASNARAPVPGSSPVNGKPSIQPAVPPLVATPPATSSSGNVIVNGSSAGGPSHSRKSSLASQSQPTSWSQQQNGLRMPPGQQPPTPSSIHFGNVSNGPHGTHVGSSPALPSTVPLALSADMTVGSPQTSPSPAPQPAASGGVPPSLPRQGMPAFGSVTENPEHNRSIPQRPVSMPPNAPLNPNMPGPPVHLRRDSAHGDGPPSGLNHGRGGMPQNTPRRNPNQMNTNYGNQVYRPPNQPRSGAGGPMGSPYQAHAHMANYSNQRGGGGGRSPALTHSLPSTPQTNPAQLAGNTPMQPSPHLGYAQHLAPHQIQPIQPMYPQGYDSGFYGQTYISYPQSGFIPPGSPRPNYHMPQPPQQPGYMPPYQGPQASSMARTGSQMSEHHIPRPPSSMSHIPHTPAMPPANIPPPLSHPGPTPPVPSNSNSQFFKKVEKSSKKIEIRDPNTGTVKTFHNFPPVAATSSSPVIVSSSLAPEQSGHARSDSNPISKTTNTKTDQEVKDEMKAKIKQIQLKKQQEEEEEARLKKEEEERKAKEEEEEQLRKQREEEERIAKEKEQQEKEQRDKEEAERKAAEEAKAKVEDEERQKREKEEAEQKAKVEEEERQRLAEEERKKKAEEAEELARVAEARRLEEIRKAASPATGTGASTPNDEDTVAEAIKASAPIPSSSKEIGDLVPDIAKITVSTQAPSPVVESQPPGKQNQRKPAPLNLQLKTSSEPALPSAALTALRSARFIDDINKVAYPPSIISPNPALNASAPNGKFKYEKDFLMQFQTVFIEKPSIDWDQRMRDTVGEPDSARPTPSTRVPSSAGAKGGRSNLPGAPPASGMGMGSFGMGSKMGQPGNIMSTAGRQPSNPFQAMGGMGSYRPSISRTGSSTQLANQGNATPQSPGGRNKPPRTGSKRNPPSGMDGRQASNKGHRNEPESAPLLAPADVKPLVVSSTRWTPRSVAAATQAAPGPTPNAEEAARLSPEMVQRKVKAALNKMTPEKFDKIADQILEIASQSRYESDGRSLRQVIQLTFEKATDEPNFSSMYAKFCKRMLESMHPDIKDDNIKDKNGNVVTGGALFRKYLLNRCQEEFERGWKVNLPPKPEGVADETVMMSDEYYVAAAAKRRGLGLIQFIGELFKLQMLTERIMHECVKKLVDYEGTPEEEEVESLCKLLRTIGFALDSTDKSRLAMDVYFNRIQQMMDSKDLNSRMKFMLLDVIELRKNSWESKEADKGPKTIAEIREEAQKAQMEKEAAAARANQRQRSQAGRGDGRSFSQGFGPNQGYQDQRQNQTLGTDELRRLGVKSLRQSTSGGPSLGPANLFGRSGSSGGSRKGLGIGGQPGIFSGGDSGPSSRTATPPTAQRESVASTNSFSLLSGHHDGAENPESQDTTSPPTDSTSLPEGKAQATETSQSSEVNS